MTDSILKPCVGTATGNATVSFKINHPELKHDSKKCSCLKHGVRGSLESRRNFSMQQIWSLHQHQVPIVGNGAFHAVLPKSDTVQMVSLTYWDDVVGPKIRSIWSQSGKPTDMPVNFCQLIRAVKYAMNHSLSGVLNTTCKDKVFSKLFLVEEENVVVLSFAFSTTIRNTNMLHSLSVIVPHNIMEFYLHLHQLCLSWSIHFVKCMNSNGSFNDDTLTEKLTACVQQLTFSVQKIERSGLTSHDLQVLNFDKLRRFSNQFLESVVESHLQNYGPTVVTGSCKKDVNAMVVFLAHFMGTHEQRTCCFVADSDRSKYMPGLAVQGLLKDGDGKIDIAEEDISWTPHPISLVDLDFEMVRQSRGHKADGSSSKKLKSKANHNNNVKILFNLIKSKGTLVKTLLHELRQLETTNKQLIVKQFCHQLKFKAFLLIKTYEKCQKDGAFLQQLSRSSKLLYNLITVETGTDFKIILAVADKLKPGFNEAASAGQFNIFLT